MSLSGNLRTMDLPDILQWVSTGRKTGTLHLQRRSVEKRIAFRDGVIYSSWSNDPRESLGQFLVRDQRLSEEQLFRALLQQERTGQMLGAILVELGLLDDEELRHTLEKKAEETVYDLFLWNEGTFEFRDRDLPADVRVSVRLPVTGVILEGVRRVDEWERIRQVFPSSATRFRQLGGPHHVADPVSAQALALAASGKTLGEIGVEMRRSDFDTAVLLFSLYGYGLLAPEGGEEERVPGDVVGTIQDLLSTAARRLEEGRHEAALTAYEQVLSLDRLNQHAKKGLIAVVEAKDRERALRRVPLDKVPVLKMDLAALTHENFDPQEGFVLSRLNGQWDVRSILKLCPMSEEDALLIFARLMDRKVIDLV